MEVVGPAWLWALLLAIALAQTVGEVQVLRGKIEEPGWRIVWDPDSRAGNVFLVAVGVAFSAFFAIGLVGALLG